MESTGASKKNNLSFSLDYVETVDYGGNVFVQSNIKPILIEDTNEYSIHKDQFGRKMKLINQVHPSASFGLSR